MKKISIWIIAIGLLITLFTGFNYVTREKVVDIGDLEITANKNHTLEWSPIVGVVMVVVGGVLYLTGSKGK
ncbi:MAG: hypothetical protein JNM78_05045 [Cyclobacteriaceae bacterium]|nr:hypothetical protein [Cyclobacteriaceae bacterium]